MGPLQRLVYSLYSLQFVGLLAVVAAVYKLADIGEEDRPAVWALAAALFYLVAWLGLGWGLLGCLATPFILAGGVTLFRLWRRRRA